MIKLLRLGLKFCIPYKTNEKEFSKNLFLAAFILAEEKNTAYAEQKVLKTMQEEQ